MKLVGGATGVLGDIASGEKYFNAEAIKTLRMMISSHVKAILDQRSAQPGLAPGNMMPIDPCSSAWPFQ